MSNELDISGLPIQDAINLLRGPVTFDALADASQGGISSQSLQRMGDKQRPFSQPPYPDSLVAAATAINRATPNRTTPWALWVALGCQFERTNNLWGRPTDREAGALGMLPAGWVDLSHDRFVAWIRNGAALVAEQRAAAQAEEMDRLRSDLAEAQRRIAQLEASAPPARKARKS